MTKDEAITILRGGARIIGFGASMPDIEGLIAGGVSAALSLVADILEAGGNPVEHITRMKAATAFTGAAEAGWREEENTLTGKIGL